MIQKKSGKRESISVSGAFPADQAAETRTPAQRVARGGIAAQEDHSRDQRQEAPFADSLQSSLGGMRSEPPEGSVRNFRKDCGIGEQLPGDRRIRRPRGGDLPV